jgi:two-component system, NtrC family, response regulator AtoC
MKKMAAGRNGQIADKENGHLAVEFIGQSPKIQQAIRVIERVARTDIPVLISGESGSGKDVVARLIHATSARASEPFLKVNCAAIPHELLESELFGHERGSFTGAHQAKPGKFELADQGTVFLDELGEMPLSIQPKLLQVLQDKEFVRIGGHQDIAVDVRFISSTNMPLERLLVEGKFREDLYYRLNVVTIQLPPLRERKEDIPAICSHLIRKHATALKLDGFELPGNIMDVFIHYEWPGNVRELENMVRRLIATGDESALLDLALPRAEQEKPLFSLPDDDDLSILSLKDTARIAARQAEREMILRALKKTNWNRRRAAQLLQISYKAMLYKLKDAGLSKHSRAASWA